MSFVMRKHTIYMALAIFILLAVVAGVVFSWDGLAQAEVVEVVYPNSGYIQAENVDIIAVSNDYTLTYDKANNLLSVTGRKYGTVQLEQLAPEWLDSDVVNKLFVFGDTAVVRASKDYVVDLTTLSVVKTNLFEECYLTTWLDKLYAHSWGKVDVFDDTLTLVESYDDNVFKNKPVMVTDGSTIFSFAVDYGVNKLYTYHTGLDTSEENNSIFVENAVMGDDIIAYDGERIVVIDKDDLSATATEITQKQYAVLGNELYIARGADGFDVYTIAEGVLTFKSNFSYGGDGLDKLNDPTSAIQHGNDLVVADRGKNRLIFVGENTVSLAVDSPTLLASAGARLFVKSDGAIVVVENKSVKSTIETDLEIVDMLYKDRLYVLTKNGVYVLISGGLVKVFDTNDAVKFEYNHLFYVLTNSGVCTYNFDGSVNELTSFDFNNFTAVDLFVNKDGNVIVLGDDNTLYEYSWQDVVKSKTMYVLLNPTSTPLEFEGYEYTAKSMSAVKDNLVFVTAENALVSVQNPLDESTDVSVKPNLQGLAPEVFKTNATTYFMTDYTVGSTSRFVADGTTVLAYDVDGKLYTKIDGHEGWIFGAEALVPTALSGEYRTKGETKIYLNPQYDEHLTLPSRTKVTLVDDGAGYDGGKWWRISVDGKIYFVDKSSLEKVVSIGPIIPNNPSKEEVKADYGRAKASRAGELVPLYSSNGNVATHVTDGTKLEIVEKVGDYYKVVYEEQEYLIHKDQFKLDGLTTVQVVAIVLSIVVVLAGTLVFAVTSLTRKKEENN